MRKRRKNPGGGLATVLGVAAALAGAWYLVWYVTKDEKPKKKDELPPPPDEDETTDIPDPDRSTDSLSLTAEKVCAHMESILRPTGVFDTLTEEQLYQVRMNCITEAAKDRGSWQCIMQATNVEELQACQSGLGASLGF